MRTKPAFVITFIATVLVAVCPTLFDNARPQQIAWAQQVTITGPVSTDTQIPPQSGQLCPEWVHDQYVTSGPDGNTYPTWHPPVDPQYGCYFGHEHGADPRTSRANADLPAFGYAAAQMGMVEPHVGFKVFVMNAGDSVESNVANKIATENVRL